jgi:hypothetical protein
MPKRTNPFDKGEERQYWDVANLMLQSGEHSFEELADACGGTLSPRSMGAILRGLESAGFRFNRRQDAEWGRVYELDPTNKAPKLASYAADAGKAPRNAPKAKKAARGPGRPRKPVGVRNREAAERAATTTKKRVAKKVRRRRR